MSGRQWHQVKEKKVRHSIAPSRLTRYDSQNHTWEKQKSQPKKQKQKEKKSKRLRLKHPRRKLFQAFCMLRLLLIILKFFFQINRATHCFGQVPDPWVSKEQKRARHLLLPRLETLLEARLPYLV